MTPDQVGWVGVHRPQTEFAGLGHDVAEGGGDLVIGAEGRQPREQIGEALPREVVVIRLVAFDGEFPSAGDRDGFVRVRAVAGVRDHGAVRSVQWSLAPTTPPTRIFLTRFGFAGQPWGEVASGGSEAKRAGRRETNGDPEMKKGPPWLTGLIDHERVTASVWRPCRHRSGRSNG
jgi:hypothetical protein